MEEIVKLVGAQAAGQSFVVILLLVAVWWLNRLNQAREASATVERKARFEDMTKRIDKAEADITRCELDRHELWRQLLSVQRDAVAAGMATNVRDALANAASKV